MFQKFKYTTCSILNCNISCIFYSSPHLHIIHLRKKWYKYNGERAKIVQLILRPKDGKKQGLYIVGFQGRDYIIYGIEHKHTYIDTEQNY